MPACSATSATLAAGKRARGLIHLARVANMVSTLIGLAMWSFMPQASTRSRSPLIALAVMAITGNAAKRGCWRISWVAV
ncbi:hypothetical protein D3C84_1171240 [compost metagenome]